MRKLPLGALAAASVAALIPAVPAAVAADPDARATASAAAAAPSATAARRSCDPNYRGRCLKRYAGDYDCAGGSGNGPNYVSGPFRVVGSDPYRLDSDGDGIACES